MKASIVERRDILPSSLPPRGLSREEAARYIGLSAATFDKLVADGRMPPPKAINARKVWDRLGLDKAFDRLPVSADGIVEGDGWEDYK